jgi:hypothetical protein
MSAPTPTYGELSAQNARLRKIVQHIYAERIPNTFFICGEAGDRDANGLPEKILVCPAYGADWSAVYTRDNKVVLSSGA